MLHKSQGFRALALLRLMLKFIIHIKTVMDNTLIFDVVRHVTECLVFWYMVNKMSAVIVRNSAFSPFMQLDFQFFVFIGDFYQFKIVIAHTYIIISCSRDNNFTFITIFIVFVLSAV